MPCICGILTCNCQIMCTCTISCCCMQCSYLRHRIKLHYEEDYQPSTQSMHDLRQGFSSLSGYGRSTTNTLYAERENSQSSSSNATRIFPSPSGRSRNPFHDLRRPRHLNDTGTAFEAINPNQLALQQCGLQETLEQPRHPIISQDTNPQNIAAPVPVNVPSISIQSYAQENTEETGISPSGRDNVEFPPPNMPPTLEAQYSSASFESEQTMQEISGQPLDLRISNDPDASPKQIEDMHLRYEKENNEREIRLGTGREHEISSHSPIQRSRESTLEQSAEQQISFYDSKQENQSNLQINAPEYSVESEIQTQECSKSLSEKTSEDLDSSDISNLKAIFDKCNIGENPSANLPPARTFQEDPGSSQQSDVSPECDSSYQKVRECTHHQNILPSIFRIHVSDALLGDTSPQNETLETTKSQSDNNLMKYSGDSIEQESVDDQTSSTLNILESPESFYMSPKRIRRDEKFLCKSLDRTDNTSDHPISQLTSGDTSEGKDPNLLCSSRNKSPDNSTQRKRGRDKIPNSSENESLKVSKSSDPNTSSCSHSRDSPEFKRKAHLRQERKQESLQEEQSSAASHISENSTLVEDPQKPEDKTEHLPISSPIYKPDNVKIWEMPLSSEKENIKETNCSGIGKDNMMEGGQYNESSELIAVPKLRQVGDLPCPPQADSGPSSISDIINPNIPSSSQNVASSNNTSQPSTEYTESNDHDVHFENREISATSKVTSPSKYSTNEEIDLCSDTFYEDSTEIESLYNYPSHSPSGISDSINPNIPSSSQNVASSDNTCQPSTEYTESNDHDVQSENREMSATSKVTSPSKYSTNEEIDLCSGTFYEDSTEIESLYNYPSHSPREESIQSQRTSQPCTNKPEGLEQRLMELARSLTFPTSDETISSQHQHSVISLEDESVTCIAGETDHIVQSADIAQSNVGMSYENSSEENVGADPYQNEFLNNIVDPSQAPTGHGANKTRKHTEKHNRGSTSKQNTSGSSEQSDVSLKSSRDVPSTSIEKQNEGENLTPAAIRHETLSTSIDKQDLMTPTQAATGHEKDKAIKEKQVLDRGPTYPPSFVIEDISGSSRRQVHPHGSSRGNSSTNIEKQGNPMNLSRASTGDGTNKTARELAKVPQTVTGYPGSQSTTGQSVVPPENIDCTPSKSLRKRKITQNLVQKAIGHDANEKQSATGSPGSQSTSRSSIQPDVPFKSSFENPTSIDNQDPVLPTPAATGGEKDKALKEILDKGPICPPSAIVIKEILVHSEHSVIQYQSSRGNSSTNIENPNNTMDLAHGAASEGSKSPTRDLTKKTQSEISPSSKNTSGNSRQSDATNKSSCGVPSTIIDKQKRCVHPTQAAIGHGPKVIQSVAGSLGSQSTSRSSIRPVDPSKSSFGNPTSIGKQDPVTPTQGATGHEKDKCIKEILERRPLCHPSSLAIEDTSGSSRQQVLPLRSSRGIPLTNIENQGCSMNLPHASTGNHPNKTAKVPKTVTGYPGCQNSSGSSRQPVVPRRSSCGIPATSRGKQKKVGRPTAVVTGESLRGTLENNPLSHVSQSISGSSNQSIVQSESSGCVPFASNEKQMDSSLSLQKRKRNNDPQPSVSGENLRNISGTSNRKNPRISLQATPNTFIEETESSQEKDEGNVLTQAVNNAEHALDVNVRLRTYMEGTQMSFNPEENSLIRPTSGLDTSKPSSRGRGISTPSSPIRVPMPQSSLVRCASMPSIHIKHFSIPVFPVRHTTVPSIPVRHTPMPSIPIRDSLIPSTSAKGALTPSKVASIPSKTKKLEKDVSEQGNTKTAKKFCSEREVSEPSSRGRVPMPSSSLVRCASMPSIHTRQVSFPVFPARHTSVPSIPVRHTPMPSIPVRHTPMPSIPIRHTPMPSIPIRDSSIPPTSAKGALTPSKVPSIPSKTKKKLEKDVPEQGNTKTAKKFCSEREISEPSSRGRDISMPSSPVRAPMLPSSLVRHASMPSIHTRQVSIPVFPVRHTSVPSIPVRHTPMPSIPIRDSSIPSTSAKGALTPSKVASIPSKTKKKLEKDVSEQGNTKTAKKFCSEREVPEPKSVAPLKPERYSKNIPEYTESIKDPTKQDESKSDDSE